MSGVLDWFSFKGSRSTAYGVYVEQLPPVTLAAERVKIETITGRSGSLAMLEGDGVYEDVELQIDCFVRNLAQLNGMAAWLQGSGNLVLPNRSGGHYVGRVINKLELERIIRAREARRFSVQFRLEPYFYLDEVESIESTETSFFLTNPGNAASAPRICVYGSGDVALAIAGQSIILTGLTDGILLDSALLDALSLDEAQLMNSSMSGDFPMLPPGECAVSWSAFDGNDNPGTVSRIVIEPRWRCR